MQVRLFPVRVYFCKFEMSLRYAGMPVRFARKVGYYLTASLCGRILNIKLHFLVVTSWYSISYLPIVHGLWVNFVSLRREVE